MSIKLITYNIQFGLGLDGKYDIDRIVAAVADSDVIALQEVETFFPRSGDCHQAKEIANRLKTYHWVYGAGVDINADEVLPDGEVIHRRQQFGNMLLSRYPILSSRNHLLPKYASTGPLSIQRSALEGVIAVNGKSIRIYSVHLTHLSSMVRLQQVERLLEIDRNAVMEGGPISGDQSKTVFSNQSNTSSLPRESILMGDFNFTPDATEYTRMVGPMSDYGGRVTNPEGFVDAWRKAGNLEMSGVTAERRGQDVRMDYVFVCTQLADRIKSAKIHSQADGSDHKPVSVVLDI